MLWLGWFFFVFFFLIFDEELIFFVVKGIGVWEFIFGWFIKFGNGVFGWKMAVGKVILGRMNKKGEVRKFSCKYFITVGYFY